MENLLLHVCCGPCAAYPLEWLRLERPGLTPRLWFYNPNIQPATEFYRRRDSLAFLALNLGLTADFSSPYEPREFLDLALENEASVRPPERCRRCYAQRLGAAAKEARRLGYGKFATSLAFSKRQKHDLIVAEGLAAAEKHGVEFYYEDWRGGWGRGHELAKSLGLYRQNYCGCLFSQMER